MGTHPTGFGTINKGMVGAGVALPQDAMTAATNPAGMGLVGIVRMSVRRFFIRLIVALLLTVMRPPRLLLGSTSVRMTTFWCLILVGTSRLPSIVHLVFQLVAMEV